MAKSQVTLLFLSSKGWRRSISRSQLMRRMIVKKIKRYKQLYALIINKKTTLLTTCCMVIQGKLQKVRWALKSKMSLLDSCKVWAE